MPIRFSLPVILFLFTIPGCGGSDNSTGSTHMVWNGEGVTVQVIEDQNHIHMPIYFPAGKEIFHISNIGSINHNFQIEGNGIRVQLPTDLLPGQTTDLHVTLTPGQYRVISPMLGQPEVGMRLDVVVSKELAKDTTLSN